MSDKNKVKNFRRLRKKKRIHKIVSGTSERPRLAVFRSARNIYAQLIDDVANRTLAGVSTLTPDLNGQVSKAKGKVDAAKLVGKAIADKAKALKVETVVFDRGGYLYHGRVRAIAEGARENGLKF
ncbi:50S ribosomal protein L18 [candidate division KSB1 bacterium]|nr:50S ribosomal protein L18 [candidate division KSB1 bacterium]MCH7754614.1 50S ribosomal protein L18 [candidate division KSB1 bacterium]MCH8871298.1 50S ribosomal protein L18 [candidate division KSB1 bacterium]MCH8953721.1 50S ribosomal protein L18 [candidate division KSB1 bacterium]